MNREIKFRAWNIPNNLMFMDIQNGVLCQNEKNQLILGVSFGTICKDAGSVVMQFTGLTDKNDKEIYEGDIVKLSNNEIGKVIYFHKRTYYFCSNTMSVVLWELIARNFYKIEVIGNIYENPELLNS